MYVTLGEGGSKCGNIICFLFLAGNLEKEGKERERIQQRGKKGKMEDYLDHCGCFEWIFLKDKRKRS